MPTSLEAISIKAKKEKKYRFRNLYRLLNEEMLHKSWRMLNKKAAEGVDGLRYEDYNQNLDENIQKLVAKLKEKKYKAKLVRRHYIDKGNGKQRPLGIPALEDKLVQHAVSRILSAIYEQDFYPCSYGYRPSTSAHQAIKDLRETLGAKKHRYIVEADIKGYFDNLDHNWLIRMLELRINDRAFLRLIKKWLKAGVLEPNGDVKHPIAGSPQGGIASPILANIYMHYVLVEWFEKVVKKHCIGEAEVYVYADDFICIFAKKTDSERFYRVLGKRLDKFNLTLSLEKTNIIDFSFMKSNSFDFLGFTFRWSRGGWRMIKIRTSKTKFSRALLAFKIWFKDKSSLNKKLFFTALNRKLKGYYNYYGIKGNYESLNKFYFYMLRHLFKRLNKRSQKKSYNWAGFLEMIKHFKLEKPRIIWTHT